MLPQLLPVRVVNNTVTLETLLHGEGLSAGWVGAAEWPQFLMEGLDMALQVKGFGERSVTVVPRTHEAHPTVSMDALMLLQKPRIPKHLAAVVTPEDEPVLLLSVFQIFSPSPPNEAAT